MVNEEGFHTYPVTFFCIRSATLSSFFSSHSAAMKVFPAFKQRISGQLCFMIIVCCLAFVTSAQQQNESLTIDNTGESFLKDSNDVKKHIQLARSLQKTNKDSAATLFYQALKACIRHGYGNHGASSLRQLIVYLKDKGNYKAYFDLCADVLKLSEHNKQLVPLTLTCTNALGVYFSETAQFDSAAVYFSRAIEINNRSGIPSNGAIENNLGVTLIKIKQFKRAIYYFDLAEKYSKQYKNNIGVAQAQINKGSIFVELKDWKNALASYKAALAVGKENNNDEISHLCLNGIGLIYLKQEMPAEALKYLRQINAVAHADPVYQYETSRNLGLAYAKLNDYNKAEKYFLQALKFTSDYGLIATDIYSTLSDLYEKTGKHQLSLSFLRKYHHLKDSIENQQTKDNINLLEIKFRTAEKDKELVAKQLEITQQNNRLKDKNLWIVIACITVVVLALLIILGYRHQKHRSYIQTQQLTNLKQQQEINELRAVMKGEEQERSRLGRELHDGILSQLAVVRFNLDMLHSSHENLPPKKLSYPLEQLITAMAELRKSAHNLIPDLLLQEGLSMAVADFCRKIEESSALSVDLQVINNIPRFKPDTELLIFRMTQELIQNVLKHANATQVIVQLSFHDSILFVTIEDNGKGMQQQENDEIAIKGTGLRGIQTKIKALKGNIEIQSAPTGTTIYLELPVVPVNMKESKTAVL